MSDETPPLLTSTQVQRIIDETRRYIAIAERAFGQPLPDVEIHLDIKGASWGCYMRKGERRRIRYNPWLFSRLFEAGLRDTIAHEVAHFVVDSLYRQRVKPHGLEWRQVMQVFGIANPRATHNDDVSQIPRRRQRRFDYHCDCGTVALSATRHYRVLRGQAHYVCRRCGQPLTQQPNRD